MHRQSPSYRTTTVLIPASGFTADSGETADSDQSADADGDPYDLTDLVAVQDELSILATDVSNNPFLSRAITQASRAIRRYCNRTFQVEAIQDAFYIRPDPYPWPNAVGLAPLQLSRFPITDVPITVTGNTDGSETISGIASTAGISVGALAFASDGSIPSGTTVTDVEANSATLSSAAASSTSGLSITFGMQIVQTRPDGSTKTLVAGDDYTVDAERGWLVRLRGGLTDVPKRWEPYQTTVQYRAGFPEIPPDLTDACLRLVTARFRARGRDPMLVQRGQGELVGVERYWIGAIPGGSGAFPPEILGLIAPYRVPITA